MESQIFWWIFLAKFRNIENTLTSLVIDDNSKLEQKIETLENTVKNLETSNNQLKDQIDGYFVMVLPIGIIGIIIAIIALIKTRRS